MVNISLKKKKDIICFTKLKKGRRKRKDGNFQGGGEYFLLLHFVGRVGSSIIGGQVVYLKIGCDQVKHHNHNIPFKENIVEISKGIVRRVGKEKENDRNNFSTPCIDFVTLHF